MTYDHTASIFHVDTCIILDGTDTGSKGRATLYVYDGANEGVDLRFPVSGTPVWDQCLLPRHVDWPISHGGAAEELLWKV